MDDKARAILAQIGLLDAPTIVLPTGGGGGGGFVAPLYAGYYYSTSIAGERLDVPEAAVITSMGTEWNQYLFVDQQTADTLHKQSGGQFGATAVHAVFCNNRDILNRTEAIETKFGDVICGTVRRVTLASKQYRHQYHMIGLPSLVHAAAVLFGHDVPDLDFSELTQQDHVLNINRDELTDEQFRELDIFFVQLCGSADAKNGQEGFYQQSAYWQQRAALWAALGETNATACHRKASGDKFSTTSDKLDECFQIALANWKQPIWGRMRLVNDPWPSGKQVFSNAGNRLSLGIVTDLWASEAEAKANAGGESESSAAVTAQGGPTVPPDYVEAGFTVATFADEVKRTGGKAVPLAAKEMGVDASIVSEWREHLGL